MVTGKLECILKILSNYLTYFPAAHCINKIPGSWQLTTVRLGEWDLNKEIDCYPGEVSTEGECAPKPQDIKVAKTIVHKDYNKRASNARNDIALLLLKTKAVFHNFVQPICLPLDPSLWDTMDYTGHSFEASGWGGHDSQSIDDIHYTSLLQAKLKTPQRVPLS